MRANTAHSYARMVSDTGDVPQGALPRAVRPLWWWFLVHGAVVCAWALFTIISPVSGGDGWIIDGVAFGVALLLVGGTLIRQAVERAPRRNGAGVFLGGGVVMLLTAAACVLLGALRMPIAQLWVIFAYLVIEGAILTLGSLPFPAYRFWGALSGAPMFAAALGIGLLAWWSPGYDLMDLFFGVLGVLYGVAVVTAALQARSAALGNRPS